MKNLIKRMLISILVVLIYTTPILAKEITNDIEIADGAEIIDATIEKTIEEDRVRVDAIVRGEWLADVALEISNPGNGNIGVLMTTSCHQPVDKILMRVYVDKLRDDNHWDQVDYKTFEFLPEDFSDGILADAIIDIQLTGFEPGVYRLRGMHLVTSGGSDEFYATETSGLEITKRFPFSDEATPNEISPSESTTE